MSRSVVLLLLAALAAPGALFAQQDEPRVEAPLVPGDVVRINVWREPDLTGEFLVQEDGTAVLPRIGSIRVTDYTPSRLKENLVAEYGKTLINPSIEIVVLRRILITGEVGSEGVYPIDTTMSLVEALAMAGGPTEVAKKDRVYLIRGGEEIEIDMDDPLDVRNVALQSGDQLVVPRSSAWIRNWRTGVAVVSSTISLIILMTR